MNEIRILFKSENSVFFLDPHDAIKYGQRVRLTHVGTGLFLHSHQINYNHPRSSGQQQSKIQKKKKNTIQYNTNKQTNSINWNVKKSHFFHTVTCLGAGNEDDVFVVSPAHGVQNQGEVVANGHVITLVHRTTGAHLHSHACPSPVTGQQEV